MTYELWVLWVSWLINSSSFTCNDICQWERWAGDVIVSRHSCHYRQNGKSLGRPTGRRWRKTTCPKMLDFVYSDKCYHKLEYSFMMPLKLPVPARILNARFWRSVHIPVLTARRVPVAPLECSSTNCGMSPSYPTVVITGPQNRNLSERGRR